MKLLFLMFMSFLFLSCASSPTGPVFQQASQKSGEALIYFYRPVGDWGGAREIKMVLDSQEFSALPEGYRPIYVKPGTHEIQALSTGFTTPKIKFQIEANTIYYLRYSLKGGSGQSDSVGLIPIINSTAPNPSILEVSAKQDPANVNLHFVKAQYGLSEISKTKLY